MQFELDDIVTVYDWHGYHPLTGKVVGKGTKGYTVKIKEQVYIENEHTYFIRSYFDSDVRAS